MEFSPYKVSDSKSNVVNKPKWTVSPQRPPYQAPWTYKYLLIQGSLGPFSNDKYKSQREE
jgi:hypothetical protein